MSGLDVNLTVAESASQKLSQAASALKGASTPTAIASQTNVSGQNNAQNTMQRISAVGQKVSHALTRDGNNIHSVAKDFAAIDQQIGKSFEGLRVLSGSGKK